jgi:hypothetical protein
LTEKPCSLTFFLPLFIGGQRLIPGILILWLYPSAAKRLISLCLENLRTHLVAYESFLPAANLPLSGVAKRSVFVVDRYGVIQYSESSDNPKQLPDLDAIRAKLAELQKSQ